LAHECVEIAAARRPDSVRVAFSLPVSRVMLTEGRVATKLDQGLALWWRQNPKGWSPPPELIERRDALAGDVVDPEAGK
jgi:hypothetical protein